MAIVDVENLLKRFDRYLKLERGLSDNTVDSYRCDVEKLVDFIQTEKLDWAQVTDDDLHRFVCALQDLGIGARSQARIISGVKSFFGFLKMEKLIMLWKTTCLNQVIKNRSTPTVQTSEGQKLQKKRAALKG